MFSQYSSGPLVRLLREGSRRFNGEFVLYVALAGLSNAALLAIINAAADNAQNEAANGQLFVVFGLTIVMYVYTQRFILFASITEVHRLISVVRLRIADRIRWADLSALEHLGRADVYGIVGRETAVISNAVGPLVGAVQATVMVIFSMIYLAMLSRVAFVITIGVTWVGLALHLRKSVELDKLWHRSLQEENDFLGMVTHLLDGFKEARLNKARSGDLYAQMQQTSQSAQDLKTRYGIAYATHFIFTQTLLFGVLAAIVFVLPRTGVAYTDVVMKLTAAILFIIGPLGGIVSALPAYASAEAAAATIFALEEKLLASGGVEEKDRPEAAPKAAFSALELRQLEFHYPESDAGNSFRLGPIDLTVRAGEIVFIVGGNGSGKSTLLKLITGLYHADRGALLLDGVAFTPATAAWVRSHFTAVFSDYHLFDRLYGLRDVSATRVNELLTLMQIQSKTSFEHGRFTTLDLSAGQRKRLALLVALLEDRPVLILDEWAADQDPQFRKFFYETLLVRWKSEGKTIIAATHDDRYFAVADRVLKMEYGQFLPTTA